MGTIGLLQLRDVVRKGTAGEDRVPFYDAGMCSAFDNIGHTVPDGDHDMRFRAYVDRRGEGGIREKELGIHSV